MWATVITAGVNTSTRRVTQVCSAGTMAQATGIGSLASCGIEAWPPLPRIVILSTSAEAMIGPPLVAITPLGIDGDWWMANAQATSSPPAPSAASRPSSSAMRAPPWPSSPGWNRNRTRPASSPRRATSSRAAPTSMAVWASCPHECMTPSCSEAKSSPVSSGIGSASMSARSSTVGPGSPPSRSATTDVWASPVRTRRPSPSSASSTRAWVSGRSRPSSGRRWMSRRRATTSSRTAPASSARLAPMTRSLRSLIGWGR